MLIRTSPTQPQENVMVPYEPSAPRRRRSQSAASTERALESSRAATLADLIERERDELLQIHAMVRCLNDVLLYADDDDSPMHADVAHVITRLLDESLTRLAELRVRVAALEAAAEEKSAQMEPLPPHQVREQTAIYSVH
jgi:hypothetical protein